MLSVTVERRILYGQMRAPIEILELPDRFFFFAGQFHGEFKSRPGKPEPEYYGFVKACLDRKLGKEKPAFYL